MTATWTPPPPPRSPNRPSQPGLLYLTVTHKRTGSETFAQILNGDRAIGALDSWVHVSAPLGHQDHGIRWTLEVRVAKPVRIYAGMTFGKLFTQPAGAWIEPD
ncbi:hypothetical protein [Salinispora fenicalii]|uniref:hypothetical protein n=1 Tax=Salinispora fenicalii TaxID=1137263 RepID=UPI0004AD4B35|nr:hypothetical protein [Salinispora fenicalii]